VESERSIENKTLPGEHCKGMRSVAVNEDKGIKSQRNPRQAGSPPPDSQKPIDIVS